MSTFNLVDEPWIPCMQDAHAPPMLLSLREVLAGAPRLWQVADPSPVITIAIYRLLLALLHRSLDGPRNAAEWRTAWQAGTWDTARVDAYLIRWRGRFDLFDDHQPFYQTASLNLDYAGAATLLTHERASDRNKPLLFDHTQADAALSPATATRYLLAQQAFSVGGTWSYDSTREPIANKYAKTSPLLKGAVCLVRGDTLFQTLMLNWHQYAPESEAPFPFHGDDLPAWERDTPTVPEERIPAGYVDLLTWQSRRILLVPEERAGEGKTVVRRCVMMKGFFLPLSFASWQAETMVAFQKIANAKAGEQPPWVMVGIQPHRLVWRDSDALYRSVPSQQERPRMLDWLSELVDAGALDAHSIFPLDVHGLTSDQAKIEDWRRSTLPLPLEAVKRPEIVDALRKALDLAEQVGALFGARSLGPGGRGGTNGAQRLSGPSPMQVLCEALLAGGSGRSPDRDAVRELARHLNTAQEYWARLDTPFRALVTRVADDFTVDEWGERRYGGRELPRWADEVRAAGREAFNVAIADLDMSGRSLRARALAEDRFRRCLHILMAPWRAPVETTTGGGA
jgi:CRISPR system Cascade subunit CasA